MKIGFATTGRVDDVSTWSGTTAKIYQSLVETGLEMIPIDSLSRKSDRLFGVKKLFYRHVLGKRYLRDREVSVLRRMARTIEHAYIENDMDFLISPGTGPLAYVSDRVKFGFWGDATFAAMLGFYPEFSNLCEETLRSGNWVESLALKNCSFAAYASAWAARSAIRDYQTPQERVFVVPFGSNLEPGIVQEEIAALCKTRLQEPCRLLFIGVDWERKGGPFAVEVAELLQRKGITTELHVVGCTPPLKGNPLIKLHGFISKASEGGRNALARLFRESTFLILPTIAECFGIVFVEAASFALPSLAFSTGGVPSALRDGKTGWALPLGSSPNEFADLIEAHLKPEAYNAASSRAYAEYSEKMTWKQSATRIARLIQDAVEA